MGTTTTAGGGGEWMMGRRTNDDDDEDDVKTTSGGRKQQIGIFYLPPRNMEKKRGTRMISRRMKEKKMFQGRGEDVYSAM